jgi:hypothetical protein
VAALHADAAGDELALGRAFARSAEGRRTTWRT